MCTWEKKPDILFFPFQQLIFILLGPRCKKLLKLSVSSPVTTKCDGSWFRVQDLFQGKWPHSSFEEMIFRFLCLCHIQRPGAVEIIKLHPFLFYLCWTINFLHITELVIAFAQLADWPKREMVIPLCLVTMTTSSSTKSFWKSYVKKLGVWQEFSVTVCLQ